LGWITCGEFDRDRGAAIPSERELIKELKKGYDYVGISFIMALSTR